MWAHPAGRPGCQDLRPGGGGGGDGQGGGGGWGGAGKYNLLFNILI